MKTPAIILKKSVEPTVTAPSTEPTRLFWKFRTYRMGDTISPKISRKVLHLQRFERSRYDSTDLFRIIVLSCFFLIFWSISASALQPVESENQMRNYLNKLRKQAGLRALIHAPIFSVAAQKHADYLAKNFGRGHFEQQGFPLFSGNRPADRVVAAGSHSRYVMENVSVHSEQVPVSTSVDGLMSAIYHRFAFLSLDHNRIGIGQSLSGRMHSYVYNLGNSNINLLCQRKSYTLPGRYYLQVCADKDFKASAIKFDQLIAQNVIRQAAIILWPPAGSNTVPPAFYKEEPDPLPKYDVSGYPISIQFNRSLFVNDIPEIKRFELFRQSDNKKLSIIKTLNKKTDQHKFFTLYQHAIFPLHRLGWDTEYRVEVDYIGNGTKQNIKWKFRTADPGLPIKTVTQNSQQFKVKSAQPFILSVTPESQRDGESRYRSSYSSQLSLEIDMLDPHTLRVNLFGESGDAEINFHGKTIVLKLE